MWFFIIKKIFGKKNNNAESGGVRNKIAGSGYVTLNIIRVCNIISLLAVAVASWIMLVMTVKTSTFFFFDGVSHFITSSISLFLIVSETGLFESYFERNWPLFSPLHGFLSLGLAMLAVGFNILGNLNKEATSVQTLGLPLWREVISSGILSSVFGLFNIAAGFVFSDKANGLTSRQVRSHDAAARHRQAAVDKLNGRSTSSMSGTGMRPMTPDLPSYNVATSPVQNNEPRRSRFNLKLPVRLSGIGRPRTQDPEQFSKWENHSAPVEDRGSPVAEGLQRPPTALHPAYGSVRRDYSPSRYSVVSNMRPF